jgi:hypothetical protein
MGIKKETIEFVNKAKEYFKTQEGMVLGSTYIDKDLGYIALRWGMFDDCLKVYELGQEVGLFEEWLDRVPDEEYINEYIKLIEKKDYKLTEEQLDKLENIIYKKRPPKPYTK